MAGHCQFTHRSASLRHGAKRLEFKLQRAPADRLKPELQRAVPEAGAPADAIRIISCPNAEVEAAFAAREILKFVHDDRAGNRFRDAAVLVRSLDGYYKPLERAFRRYGIPFFSTGGNPWRITPGGIDPQHAPHGRVRLAAR